MGHRALIVACEPRIGTSRLPALFRQARLRVDVLGPRRGPINTSVLVERFVGCTIHDLPTTLRKQLSKHDYDWVTFADEATLYRLLGHCREDWLRPHFPVPVDGPWPEIITSKADFTLAAQRAGITMPVSHVCRTVAEVESSARAIGLPCMLKGDRGAAGQTVFRIDSYDEIAPALRRMRVGPWVVQQFIDGRLGSTQVLYNRGRPACWLGGFRKNVYPEPYGPTTCRQLFEHPGMAELIEKIGSMTRVHGLCGVDWMLDANDRLFLLELNARPTPCYLLAPYAGVDLVGAIREIVQGRSPRTRRPKADVSDEAPLYLWPEHAYRCLAMGRLGELRHLLPLFGRNDVVLSEPRMMLTEFLELLRRARHPLGKGKASSLPR